MNTQLYHSLNTWKDFEQALIPLNKKEKGNAFELLTKYYFQFDPAHRTFYDEVWLFNEVPSRHLEILGLPSQDLGIDLIARVGNEYHAIQCKYHSDKKESVTFREVATFLSLFESNSKISKGYICSSADLTSKNLDKVRSEHISLILSDTWNNLSKDFFESIKAELNKKKVQLIPYSPKPHQEKALNEAKKYFLDDNHNRGKLIFPCGAGKSLTGFWMTQELGANSIIVAVPSLSLVKQTLDVYLREIVALGQKVKWLCICSDEGIGKGDDIAIRTENIGVPCVTDPVYIQNWLNEHKTESKIIFTTYQSGRIIAEVSKRLNYSFDLGIFDEAHKTVGSDKKLFSHLLFEENISISKRVFMTATERFYAGSKDDIISMDNEDVYGETFTQMSFKEAIETGLLTDYKVITIDVKRSEIAEFIQENKLVELNGKWKKDTEARSLASMLALRKAMKLFPIHNAVSFHSSIEKAVRNKELQQFITDSFTYDKIDTFTVSGEMPTTKRNEIVREFAESSKALITNARCLTEGVDVPNIDCIVFADPRKSKVDIVQALGRALRKKEGKDWGYVILPVIYDDATHEIDNENFNEIMAIVRGLASNDERIVEYFKDKNTDIPKKRNEKTDQFQFEVFSDYIDAEELSSQLQIKLWEKLSRFNWMPFEEAREYVRGLKLNDAKEYTKWCSNRNALGLNIPFSPHTVYGKDEWISWGDWLGTGRIARGKEEYWTYIKAREFVHSLKLRNVKEWNIYYKSKLKPSYIPASPKHVYEGIGWIGFGDWLGTNSLHSKNIDYLSFKEAFAFAKSLNLKSYKAWQSYVKREDFPKNIPKAPEHVYKNNGWQGWLHFLGNENRKIKIKEFYDFNDAKKKVIKLNITNNKEWRKYCKNPLKDPKLPYNPEREYELQWKSWGDFLGTGVVSARERSKEYLNFEQAKEIVQQLKLKNRSLWFDYHKINKPNMPRNPDITYKNQGWKGWGDFLGTGVISAKERSKEYLNFEQAKEIVQQLKLKNRSLWFEYHQNTKPSIPRNPDITYKNQGWQGWGDFLGTGTVAHINKEFISFEKLKNLVKNHGVKTQSEWYRFYKGLQDKSGIPFNPQSIYKQKGWKNWADFLGKS
jgi:superfamily II DNA or RNA helicase